MPFYTWQPFGTPYLNITYVAFFLYLGISALSWGRMFSFDWSRHLIVPLLGILVINTVMSYVNDFEGGTVGMSWVRGFALRLTMFWLLCNELMRYPHLGDRLLAVFAKSMTLLAAFYLVGFGVSGEGSRLSMFGVNSNSVGLWCVMAIVFVAHLASTGRLGVIQKLYFLIMGPVLIAMVGLSGSRGAVVFLVVSISSYYVFMNRPLINKMLIGIPISILLLGSLYLIMNTDVMSARLESALDDPTLSGRVPIWEATIDMFKENPLFGIGATGYEARIIGIFGVYQATHNEFLTILVQTGIIGMLMFAGFLITCSIRAIAETKSRKNPLPITLVLLVVLVLAKTGGAVNSFTTWFMFAYAIVPTSYESSSVYFSARRVPAVAQ